MQFSGIRDYGATEMNLGNADEHILITGPNGAGKSTISFCMGAVLRSSKVDIDGLKSQNLPEGETWRAAIHFLFKNEGDSRIDAPLYIEFRLLCEQLPKQPIKLQYEIHDGDELEQLELRQIYRSGDVNKNNFTAYRRDLQFKYKIHPDLYYLIWYQQEVNQFSVMAPEERFRIFSEMHRIDSIQKDWETSLEVVKEAHEAFRVATSKQKGYEFDLNIARDNKERFENNKKRLESNGYQYAVMTTELQRTAEKEQIEMEKYIKERIEELEELAVKESALVIQMEEGRKQKEALNGEQEACEKELDIVEKELAEKEKRLSTIESEVEALRGELSEVQEAYRKLPYSESETKNKWISAGELVKLAQEKEQAAEGKVKKIEDEIENNREEQSTLRATITQWEEQSEAATELLVRYKSSYQLKEKLFELENSLQTDRTKQDALKYKLRVSNEELSMLEKNQIESTRQQAAIHFLNEQSIQAYTLRHFVKLMDNMPIEKERLYDAIKYTIFYDAKTCQPFNDLYHVSLKKVIPNRSITSLPQYGVDIREGLTTEEQNHAMRILWWIEQFYIDDAPALKNGLLVDARGVRGPQEKDTFILSKKALKDRRNVLERKVQQLKTEIDAFTTKIVEDNEIYRVWNADVQKLEEAEAFLSKKMEQQYRLERLENLATVLMQSQQDKKHFQQEAQKFWKQAQIEQQEVQAREGDLVVYAQFGQQSEKIERLQRQENDVKNLKQEITALRRLMKKTLDTLEHLQGELRKKQWSIEDLEEDARKTKHIKGQITEQKAEKEDERIAMATLGKQYEEELGTLKLLIPELVKKAVDEEPSDASKYNLQNRQNQAKVEFENARNEKNIDPNAVENYMTLEQEVQRKKDELQAAKNLLEENEERAIQNEQRLETAIAMQVQKINLLFGEYMGNFQFEGQIKYEKLMDKKGRPIFKLFIHVRKEGHRGKLVDVSLKARGGRVGKGVSGGEESLSSLLFALALLQNLENQAGFIVLDEFDSALDDTRKSTVFELYAKKLNRKLIILSPKAHENEYYHQFKKAFIISHDPAELKSKVRGVAIK